MIGLILAASLYTVKPGDTLSGIVGARWPTVCEANHLVNCNLIYPGEVINTEGVSATVTYNSGSYSSGAGDSDNGVHDSVPSYQSPSSVPIASYSGFQACVIARESGGNSQVMNSTGHYGLYQFSLSTWEAYGGSASDFGNASVAEQNQVFANAMAKGGESNWSPYDGCLHAHGDSICNNYRH